MKKSLLVVAILCSNTCYTQQPPANQQQEQPDYGPMILRDFLSIVPGLFVMAAGNKSGDPQLAAAGLNQVANGISGFINALQLQIATRKPEGLRNLMATLNNKELLAAYLDEELESENGVRSIHSWEKSLKSSSEQTISDTSCSSIVMEAKP